MKKFNVYVIILTLILCIIFLNIPKTDAEVLRAPAAMRYGLSSLILQDNLNDEFGPATDKIIAEKEKMKVKVQKGSFQPVSDIKFDNTIKIKVNSITFVGNSAFNTAELSKYTLNMIGKEVTALDLSNLASEITDLYQRNGYTTSKAVFDPQKIKDGNVEIKIIEGKIGNISINNNKWAKTSYIKNNFFKANDFNENKIFNINNLNNSYTDLNNNDYLKGEVTLQENKINSDKTDLQLNIKDRFPVSFNTGWDNMGRYNTGISRAILNLSDNNLTGVGDKLYVEPIFTTGSFGINTGYIIPVGRYGTEIRLGYSYANANSAPWDIEGYSLSTDSATHLFRTSIIQPLYKNDHLYFLSDLSFDILHTQTSLNDFSYEFERQDLRVLRAGISGIEQDKAGKLLSRFEVSTGLPILGGTSDSSYGEESSKFLKFYANLLRTINLPYEFTGILRAKGQYSPDFLPSFEALQIGGMNSVRGFDQGLLAGGNGYFVSFELQKPVPYLRDFNLPYWQHKTISVKLKDRIKLAAFYDQGFVKNIHIGEPHTFATFLQSVGTGLRIKLTRFLQANLDLGIPIGEDRTPDQTGVKFIFSISSNLL